MGGGGKKGGSPLQVKRSFSLLPSCRKRTTKEELEGNPEKQEGGKVHRSEMRWQKREKSRHRPPPFFPKLPRNPCGPTPRTGFLFRHARVPPYYALRPSLLWYHCTSTTVLLRSYTMIPHSEEKAPLSSSAPFSLVALPRPADGGEGGADAAAK